jgi:hypothetical protein
MAARSEAGYGSERDATIEKVLARIGEPAVPPIIALLGKKAWVNSVLTEIGKPAVAPLMAALRSSDYSVRMQAADVLVEMQSQDPTLVQPLMAALQESDLGFIAENYAFYIRLGLAGTEDTLIRALSKHGGKQMCVDYLNCGNEKLDAAARQWAANHGYTVTTGQGYNSGPQWGEGTG